MKKIIIWMLSILLIASCNSARIYDVETYIVAFKDGTFVTVDAYNCMSHEDSYELRNLDGNQFFDKEQVKFIYIKNDKESEN